MAHFAELDENNVVLRVCVVSNEDLLDDNGEEAEWKGQELLIKQLGGRWVQTSYNGNLRKRYAGIGMTYDKTRDAFIHAKPYESWVLDEETCDWVAPVPAPDDGKHYYWDEDTVSWVEVVIEQ